VSVSLIDPTARVADGADIAADAEVGPYCVIGPNVKIGSSVRLLSHVCVTGMTTIGDRTIVYPFASLGTPPQSVHYRGELTRLVIGDDCVIREHVTMNIGTASGNGVTRVGDRCFLMTGAHVAHDSIVGREVTFANNATLGGHCEIGDYVFLGGLCAAHQFVRIGESAIIGGLCGVFQDVIPFAAVVGHRGKIATVNRIGLKRRGFTSEAIHNVHRAYRQIFFGAGTLAERAEEVARAFAEDANVMRIVEFVRTSGKRQLTTPRSGPDDH
jgi:UDP-N-acetylglucosamine acyltransferase